MTGLIPMGWRNRLIALCARNRVVVAGVGVPGDRSEIVVRELSNAFILRCATVTFRAPAQVRMHGIVIKDNKFR